MPEAPDAALRPRRPSARRRVARGTLVVVDGVLALVGFVAAASVLFADVPYLGYLNIVNGPFVGPFLVVSLAALLLAVVARLLGSRSAAVVAGVALLGAVGHATVLTVQWGEAHRAGADVSAIEALRPGLIMDGPGPDETVVYTRDGGADLTLDLYRPAGETVAAPVVMYTHGGGWIGGSSRSSAANLRWFADHGYLALGVNYTLATADRATWDTALPQVLCAFSWVRANAGRYGGDPSRFYVWGESAGGALALSSAYAATGGMSGEGVAASCGGSLPRVRAVVADVPAVDPVGFYANDTPVFGPLARTMVTQYLGGSPDEHPDRAAAVASARFIHAGAPPTYLTLSENDHLVPIAGAEAFVEQARAAGIDVVVVRRAFADHSAGLSYHGIANQMLLDRAHALFVANGALG